MRFLGISLVLFGLRTVFTVPHVFSMPSRESDFINERGDTMVAGKIISTDTNFLSVQNLCQIKVEKHKKSQDRKPCCTNYSL